MKILRRIGEIRRVLSNSKKLRTQREYERQVLFQDPYKPEEIAKKLSFERRDELPR